MPDQWRRALVRAALREVGYDAVGAPTLDAALHLAPADAERGAVRLVIIDQPAIGDGDENRLARLLERHDAPATLLLARATVAPPAGAWTRVMARPVTIADVVAAVAELVPLPESERHPLD
jgi:hypothetical protein